MIELLAVLMIFGLVAWLATGQVVRLSTAEQGADVAEERFRNARLLAARSGTPQVLEYGVGPGTAPSEGAWARIVVFPDGTFSRLSGAGEEASLADPPGFPRRVFHALEVR